jgi:hypothetical protein
VKASPLLALALLSSPFAAPAAEPPSDVSGATRAVKALRVYVAGESIEQYNRYVAPPFTATGALNDRGGGALRNDNEEYGWMVPLRDRLSLRAPDLTIQFVGSGTWTDGGDYPYSGTYPTTEPEPTSAIAGTSIRSWLDQRREELERKTFCYDVAFASRSGNDFGNDDDASYREDLKELILLLWRGSSCRTDPVVVVTGHMPDDQRDYTMTDAAYVALQKHRFVERARQAADEAAAANPTLRVRFVDQYTPFTLNTPTTAFPSEAWSQNGIPDFGKIARDDDLYHPRRLASIYAGELAADGLDLAEMRALAGSSPEVTYSWLLPSSARSQGAGTFWTTDLDLRNGGSSAATATVKFLGHAGDGRGGPEQLVSLAAGESRRWPDVLGTLFGLGGDYGPILVTSNSSGFVVQGQTSTPGGGGTFGQSVPALAAADLVGATPRSILGVRQDASFRTNLMLANAGDAPIEVHVDLVTPGGVVRTTRQVPLGPLGFAQLNVASDLDGAGLSSAAIEVSVSTPGGRFAAYASAIDQATGDPRTLLVGADSGGAWLLPSSARVAGVGAFWTTDLVLRNASWSRMTVAVKFLGHSGDGRDGPETSLDLAIGESRTIPDVLGSLFGLESDYGPILVTPSVSGLVVQGQTFTPGGGGTFGQSVPGVPRGALVGSVPRSIAGVRQDGSFRTNLMLANATESALDVDVALVGASGGAPLATRRVPLGPLGFAQLNVANDLGVDGVSAAAFVLSTPTTGGAFAAYASAIDRATGDPRTLLPR